jgi:hypothetical protein
MPSARSGAARQRCKSEQLTVALSIIREIDEMQGGAGMHKRVIHNALHHMCKGSNDALSRKQELEKFVRMYHKLIEYMCWGCV